MGIPRSTPAHGYRYKNSPGLAIATELHEAIGQSSLHNSTKAILLPPVTLSCSHEHETSISLRPETLLSILGDITEQCNGLIVIVNAHGENHIIEHFFLQQNRKKKPTLWFPRKTSWKSACESASIETPFGRDVHAGEIECSLMMVIPQSGLDMSQNSGDHFCDDHRFWPVTGMSSFAKEGVIGAPSLASDIKGHRFMKHLVESALEEIALIVSDTNK